MKAVKEEKKQAVKDLHDKFSESKVAILMEFSGLSVAEMTDLRRKLRTQKGELKVVKNSLARRAVEGTGLSESVDAFKGPIAVTFGFEDPVGPAKVIKEFSDEVKGKAKLKVGIVEGDFADAQAIARIASLPKKEVLITDLVSRMQSPISGLVNGLHGVLRQLVFVLSAVQEKKQ
ncbi:MAG TPA: 50S ribosomal protein L10 [Nitrospiria bacterium]|nr:50S ribosomal protein L10 [Nitrospiria bacterium]